MKFRWLGLGLAVGLLSLTVSAKTYLTSVNKQEVQLATLSSTITGLEKSPVTLDGFSKSGKLRISLFPGFEMPGRFSLTYNGQSHVVDVPLNGYGDTEFKVSSGDTVKMVFEMHWEGTDYLMYGFVPPQGDLCGLAPFAQIDIKPMVEKVEAYGEDIIEIQCWNDEEKDPDINADFNEAVVILSYVPGSISDDDDDDDDSDDDGDEARFVIRAFEDEDEDRKWDEDEASVGEEITFEYRVNDGDWKEYATDTDSGWGDVIKAGLGSKIEIKAENLDNFTMTGDSPQVKILDNDDTYYFDFGYVNKSSVGSNNDDNGSSDFRATQPDTGTATWLTLGVLGLGLGLLVTKMFLKKYDS